MNDFECTWTNSYTYTIIFLVHLSKFHNIIITIVKNSIWNKSNLIYLLIRNMYKVIGIFLLLLNTIRKDTGTTNFTYSYWEKKDLYIC